ncbi:MAG TPA: DUF4333 domain-containing protein [Solirubrobacterales bacterium]|jgi:hypothetical protein|nr:DUF4333 domain-containing protein [Solirubrobacterales bacterium]
MSLSGRIGAVVALCVAGILVVGCGETVIDSSKAEGAIQSNLEKSLHHKVSSVSCPSEQKVEPNATFTCAVVFSNGKKATATLKILNKNADVSLINLQANK